jgi:hypothetical protein
VPPVIIVPCYLRQAKVSSLTLRRPVLTKYATCRNTTNFAFRYTMNLDRLVRLLQKHRMLPEKLQLISRYT